jgi:hypothetical protein
MICGRLLLSQQRLLVVRVFIECEEGFVAASTVCPLLIYTFFHSQIQSSTECEDNCAKPAFSVSFHKLALIH